MLLRNYAHPKPTARTWRSAMSPSAAAKSNAFTKPRIIRCGNQRVTSCKRATK